MDDSELFNLTVVELRSLCNDKGLETSRLRKKQIVELLLENGVSEIPADLKNRGTPRKSPMTTRKSLLTPQKNLLEQSSNIPRTATPRRTRYQRRTRAMELREAENSDKENDGDESEVTKAAGKAIQIADGAHENSPVKESPGLLDQPPDVGNNSHGGSASSSPERALGNGTEKGSETEKVLEGSAKTPEDDGDAPMETPEAKDDVEDAPTGEAIVSKESGDAVSNSSFTTAMSSANSTFDVEKEDDKETATPRKSRKRWSTSITEDFNFARRSNSSAEPTQDGDDPPSSPGDPSPEREAESGSPVDDAPRDGSPERPHLTRRQTFTVETPASKSTPGVSKTSKPGFKASKTPNFKKIHERNQAKFENIADYSARKRERMRALVSSTKDIRSAAAASREATRTPKTPLRSVKAISQSETPASERKILSNKVRSNRRFELLMKARGLPMNAEAPEHA
ncbi:serine/arginine repetitive matrix protein 2 [Galendromus occidentalis]|uniref:Serine/arginine repetitive matrix protein 2 n=1 Tax=Galendromus occidentalis TaxID=34638 RepID=A0AAJ7L7H0_9ACAR|nr:serine/arginine repetitive matrix protein 2 [Galendromus occidentalis]